MDNQETVAQKPSRQLQQSGKHPSQAPGMLGIRWPSSNIKISNSALTESPIEKPDNALRVDNRAPPLEVGLTTPKYTHARIKCLTGLWSRVFQPRGGAGEGERGRRGTTHWIAATCTQSPARVLPHPLDTNAANTDPKGPLNLAEEPPGGSETMSPPRRVRRSQAPVAAE